MPVMRWTTAELLTAYESTAATRGIALRTAPRIVLADIMIHHQDIRRPLELPRPIPADHHLTVLRHPDPFLLTARLIRGLHFTATDLTWTPWRRPQLTGPAEAIMLAIAGRPAALADLHGEGVDTLRQRIEHS